MKKRYAYLVIVFVFAVLEAAGQDIQYTQFYAAPIHLNPALAGTGEGSRFIFNFRSQWAAVPKAYTSYNLSYDQNLSHLNSGIGFWVTRDQAGTGGMSTTTIGGTYAYDLKVNRYFSFRPALGLSYNLRAIDASKLTFNDQLVSGNSSSYSTNLVTDQRSYIDITAGFIGYGENYWFGYSVYHINRPNNSLIGQENLIAMRHNVHGGYRFILKKSVKGIVARAITVAANYKAQDKWDQFDIGLYFRYDIFLAGLWYRGIPGFKAYQPGYSNNDAAAVLVGVEWKNFRFVYSYDATISGLWANSGGSHEISLTYDHPNKERKRKRRPIRLACPKF